MKTKLLSLAILACSVLGVMAIPIGLSSPKYVGSIINGAPASAANEVQYINILIDMAVNTTLDPNVAPNTTGEAFARSSNVGLPPDALVAGTIRFDPPASSNSYNLTGWDYMLVKTGGASYVFYVASLSGSFELDNSFPSGISHISLYDTGVSSTPFGNDPPPAGVPDGGSTLACMGVALIGLGSARRLIRTRRA